MAAAGIPLPNNWTKISYFHCSLLGYFLGLLTATVSSEVKKLEMTTKVFKIVSRVLYVSFDKFLLAVESRDLSQADKSIIRVSSFPKLRMSSRSSLSVS